MERKKAWCRNTRKITSAAENILSMSLMTKLTLALTLNDPHDDVENFIMQVEV